MSPIAWSSLARLPVELRQRWAAGRVFAARQAPYLASALLALEPVVVEGAGQPTADIGSFPVDPAWHIHIDPSDLAGTDVPTLGFWLVHQVSHLLRRHADRYPGPVQQTVGTPNFRRSLEQVRWNMATDAEINDDVSAGEIVAPPEVWRPSHIGCAEGLVAEEYWDALDGLEFELWQVVAAELGNAGPGWPAPGQAGKEAGRSAGRGDGGRGDGDSGDGGSGDCGSGCDGQPRPWDCGRSGLGEAARKLLAREVAQRIKEHSRARGDTPAGWQRWADEVLEPTVSWQHVLSAAVRRGVADVAGRVDFSYRKPSRRAASVPDVVLPSLRQPLPKVAMVLDTSGSMSDQMLGQALAEVGGVLRGLGVGRRHLRVVCCDAKSYDAQRVLDAGDVRLLGGGGTDMGAGLSEAATLKPRPDLVIVLTDGHTPWPSAPPARIRVIVGLMDPAGRVPEWATAIEIQPEPVLNGW